MGNLFRRMWRVLRRSRFERELREEIETHRLLRAESLRRNGLAGDNADAASHRALGNVALAREDAALVWHAGTIDGLWQDIRHAGRATRREPLTSAIVVGSLAFGIGLASAIFAFSDAYLSRALPFVNDDELYVVRDTAARGEWLRLSDVDGLRTGPLRDLGFVTGTGGAGIGFGTLRVGEQDLRVMADGVQLGFAELMGVPLVMGRSFQRDDYLGQQPVPVWLSHRFWQSAFGGDPGILDRTLTFTGGNRTLALRVIGVTDPLIRTFDPNFGANNPLPDLFAPAVRLEAGESITLLASPIVRVSSASPVVEVEAAISAALQAVGASSNRPAPQVRLDPLRDVWAEDGRALATALSAGGVLALVLVVVNLVHLLLARGVARASDLAMRVTLGASRWRVARVMLIESALTGTVGIALGLFGGRWLTGVVTSALPTRGSDGLNFAVMAIVFDARVVAAALVGGAVVVLLGAGWPIWRAVSSVARPVASLRPRGAPRVSVRFSTAAIVCEVAAATVILVGTASVGLGIWRYVEQPLGFDLRDRLTVVFQRAAGADDDAVTWSDLLRTVRALDGVRRASVDEADRVRTTIRIAGRQPASDDLSVLSVAPEWFEARGTELVAGRLPRGDEGGDRSALVVVDQKFARLAWPGADAVGQPIELEGQVPKTVIGVIAEQRARLSRDTPGLAFVLNGEVPARPVIRVWAPGLTADDLLARMAGPASVLAPNHTPVVRTETFARVFADDLAPIRFQWPILVALGAFATTLTAIGLFGLVAYTVEQRRRDMGIRLALGAGQRQLATTVVRLGLRPALIGLTIGLAAAVSVQRVIAATTFGWPVAGYLAMLLVAAVVFVIVVLAVVAPVRRVLALQPSEILRAD